MLVLPLLISYAAVRSFRGGVKVLCARTLARDADGGLSTVSDAAIAATPTKADPLRITLTALSRSFTTKYKYESDETARVGSATSPTPRAGAGSFAGSFARSIDEHQTAGFYRVVKTVLCCDAARADRATRQRGRSSAARCLPRPRALPLALACALAGVFCATVSCVAFVGGTESPRGAVLVVRVLEQLFYLTHQCVGAAVALFLGFVGANVALPPVGGASSVDGSGAADEVVFKAGTFRSRRRACSAGSCRACVDGARGLARRVIRCCTVGAPHIACVATCTLAVVLPAAATASAYSSSSASAANARAAAQERNVSSASGAYCMYRYIPCCPNAAHKLTRHPLTLPSPLVNRYILNEFC